MKISENEKILLFIYVIYFLMCCNGQESQLPKPSGKYDTVVNYLTIIDSSRKELFDNEGKKYRELTIKVWYQVDKETKCELYMEDPGKSMGQF